MTVGTSGRFGRGATSLQNLIDVLVREYIIEELFLIDDQQNLAAFLKCWCDPNIPHIRPCDAFFTAGKHHKTTNVLQWSHVTHDWRWLGAASCSVGAGWGLLVAV